MQVQEKNATTTGSWQTAYSNPVTVPLAWTVVGQEFSNRWDAAKNTLSDWLQHPEYFSDDESESPSRLTFEIGINIAETMKRAGNDTPDRVIVTTEGGIAFEWREGSILMRLELYPDGQLDLTIFENSQLTEHLQRTIDDFISEYKSLYLPHVD